MNCFLAYRASEADFDEIKKLLSSIRGVLNSLKIENYSVLLDYVAENENSGREFMDQAFKKIDNSDFLLVIQNYNERSEGMLMEVGYCIAKGIPVIVAKKNEVTDTYLPEMTDFNIPWNDVDDLLDKIKSFDFHNLSN
jgi:nucleoside 2-deoxyribosyltransferase